MVVCVPYRERRGWHLATEADPYSLTSKGVVSPTTGVFVGEGPYDGFYAIFENEVMGNTWNLHGYIIEGNPPEGAVPYAYAGDN